MLSYFTGDTASRSERGLVTFSLVTVSKTLTVSGGGPSGVVISAGSVSSSAVGGGRSSHFGCRAPRPGVVGGVGARPSGSGPPPARHTKRSTTPSSTNSAAPPRTAARSQGGAGLAGNSGAAGGGAKGAAIG